MILDDDTPEVFMHYNFNLRLVRIVADTLVSTKMKIKIEFSANPEAGGADIARVWNKIDFWLESADQCIAIWASNPLAVDTVISAQDHAPRFMNNIMILPSEPTEEIFGYIIQAKLNALGEDVVAFGAVEIESEENNGIVFNVIGDPSAVLPKMEDWMGSNNWFNTPWWNRDDGSMLDAQPPEEADLNEKPDWAYAWDFLGSRPKPAGVVISARFKPRLVDEDDK